MLDGTQEDELIRQAASEYSVAPEILIELLALAPQFENFDIRGVKVEFSREVKRILDDAAYMAQNNGANP